MCVTPRVLVCDDEPRGVRAVLRDAGFITVGQAVAVRGTGTPESQGRILPNCTSSP